MVLGQSHHQRHTGIDHITWKRFSFFNILKRLDLLSFVVYTNQILPEGKNCASSICCFGKFLI